MLLSFIFYSIKLHVDGRGPHVAPAEAFDSKFRSNLTLALGTGAALVGVWNDNIMIMMINTHVKFEGVKQLQR